MQKYLIDDIYHTRPQIEVLGSVWMANLCTWTVVAL